MCSTLFPGHSIPSPILDLIKPHPTLLNLIDALDIPTIISGFTYCRHRIYLPSSWIYLPLCLDYFSKFLQKSNMVINFLFYSKKNLYGDHFLILPWWSFSDVDHFLYSPVMVYLFANVSILLFQQRLSSLYVLYMIYI